MSPSLRHSYQAYHQATHTVAKTRQVVMLYDGVIRNLQQAGEAMKAKNIEDRFNKLVRASEIIAGLQMSLDFEEGGELAQILYDFYSSAESQITKLHRNNNSEQCEALVEEVKKMRAVWDQIDREVGGETKAETESAESSPEKQSATRSSAPAESVATHHYSA